MGQECTGQPGPGLQLHFIAALLGKPFTDRPEVQAATSGTAVIGRQADHRAAAGLKPGESIGCGRGIQGFAREQHGTRQPKERGVWVGHEPAIEQHPQGLPVGEHLSHIEQRLVLCKGAHTGEHRTRTGTPCMAIGPTGRVGDPLALAVRKGRSAIE